MVGQGGSLPPQRNPTQGFLAGQLYSRAKVPALTLPITGERHMEKHHRNRDFFFSFVGFGSSRSERQIFILPKIFVRTMLFNFSFYLFNQTKIQSPQKAHTGMIPVDSHSSWAQPYNGEEKCLVYRTRVSGAAPHRALPAGRSPVASSVCHCCLLGQRTTVLIWTLGLAGLLMNSCNAAEVL